MTAFRAGACAHLDVAFRFARTRRRQLLIRPPASPRVRLTLHDALARVPTKDGKRFFLAVWVFFYGPEGGEAPR